MAKSLTDPVLLVCGAGDAADMRYASGFMPVDPVVLLCQGREQVLVVPLLELGRAVHEAPQARVVTPQELPIPKKRRRRVSAWALGVLKKYKIKRVLVPPSFPAGVYHLLRKAGIKVRIAEESLFPGRMCKRADEVENIRAAQRAAVAAMRTAVQLIAEADIDRKGVLQSGGAVLTSERVRMEIDLELLRHRCHARDTIVAGGRQAADPHDRGSGPLRAGQTIVLDIFPQHKEHGYWGDITRTVIRGQPTATQRQMYAAVRAAQTVALSMIRPGAEVRVIHEAVQGELEAHGFKTSVEQGVATGFFHGTGHGVGLDIHEAPSISPNDAKLREGHVVTVEPGLYYPEHGGVRIEDTVVVTKEGWKYLAVCPKVFEI